MKKLYTHLAAAIITASVFAQSPEQMSYQAVIRDGNNTLVANQVTGMQISILQGSTSGTAVYMETQQPTSNANGLISIEIGNGTVVSGNFSSINWANGPYYVKTETDPTGGTSYSITGTSQLLSVPYALYAKTAGSTTGGSTYYIGELYGGGIIFYLYKDTIGVEHGLIASLDDLSISAQWGLDGTDVPSCESSWNGQANTSAIISAGGIASDAAGLCDAYNGGGLTDWYLPSSFELSMLLSNGYLINKNLPNGSDELTQVAYWSSTENLTNQSNFAHGFALNGTMIVNGKSFTAKVRAIRAF